MESKPHALRALARAKPEPEHAAMSFPSRACRVRSVVPTGDAIATWTQRDGRRVNAWSSRYTPGIGWREAELIGARSPSWQHLGNLRCRDRWHGQRWLRGNGYLLEQKAW